MLLAYFEGPPEMIVLTATSIVPSLGYRKEKARDARSAAIVLDRAP
jgi:hypothetical protein